MSHKTRNGKLFLHVIANQKPEGNAPWLDSKSGHERRQSKTPGFTAGCCPPACSGAELLRAGEVSPGLGWVLPGATPETNTSSRAALPDRLLGFQPRCHPEKRRGRRAVCVHGWVSFHEVPLKSWPPDFFLTMSFVQSKTTWICSPKLYLPIICMCQDGNYQGLNLHSLERSTWLQGTPTAMNLKRVKASLKNQYLGA